MMIVDDNKRIEDILKTSKNIAVVGLSPKPHRDSYMVARYMQGYRIIPVHPKAKEILGETVYPDLLHIPDPIDIVNVFRAPDKIIPIAEEAVKLKPKVFWMQLGIKNNDAARLLADAGIMVVMNRCLKIEHMKMQKTYIAPKDANFKSLHISK
jgi:predicted CoA-binding protein